MAQICPTKGKHILNPIIDWTTEEVWEFIRTYKIPYCKLYDEGFTRLGCIGCPMSSRQVRDFDRWPKYKQAYLKAFDRMLKELNRATTWKTAEDVMDWWIKKG